jgi:hypothetical protein
MSIAGSNGSGKEAEERTYGGAGDEFASGADVAVI